MRTVVLRTSLLCLCLFVGCNENNNGSGGAVVPAPVGDEAVITEHLSQAQIEAGKVLVDELIEAGRALFVARFNTLDGALRPETTGTGAARSRREGIEAFNRISAPDSNSCAGCHNKPFAGGGGDNVANVFVLGQRMPFINFDASSEGDQFEAHRLREVANERNTLGMFGAGFIELLAREMTADLRAIRDEAIAAAQTNGAPEMRALETKGVSFGTITANADGSVDTSAVEGIDADLIVKPFHQKGVVISLREFTNNAMNHHHGMQSVERFGEGMDPDNDGVTNELTVGDMTAVTLFQATLQAPGRVLPDSMAAREAVDRGEARFAALGCTSCHTPELVLESPIFTEPSPLNPAGNLRPEDVTQVLEVDLTTEGPGPHLTREADGSVKIHAYTDLKRHDMGPGLDNEALVQAGVPTNEFLTKKLWGMANEPPFMHHGRALTIDEAILMHGGEAQAARDAYAALTADEKGEVVEFLQTLQVLSPDAPSNEIVERFTGRIGDDPAVLTHLDEGDVEMGALTADELFQRGKELFDASFNTLDGAGRPASTGTGAPRARREAPENFNRISGPDSNACSGCHNIPRSGGGGDNVANVFVLGQRLPFVDFDAASEGDGFEDHFLSEVANERNTLGMFGSGYIELLAREMTTDLHAIRDAAIAAAQANGAPEIRALTTKGVSFGSITANPDGSVDASAVDGVDVDLTVKPFHQKGVVVSLREFTNNAMNHHHGMQSSERFGAGLDPDDDGVTDELTVGDITAVTLYQAMLAVPGRVMPKDSKRKAAVEQGEELFKSTGCATCHIPELRLESPIFTEPNPFNPAGNLRPADVAKIVEVDLTTGGPGPHLAREGDGSVLVPAFTDLKRHDIGVELDNEALVQAGVPTNEFLTKKLWGMANEPPFLHHGRALTIDDAILAHGGEAEAARVAYEGLTAGERASIVDFLKTLQVLPEDSPLVVEE